MNQESDPKLCEQCGMEKDVIFKDNLCQNCTSFNRLIKENKCLWCNQTFNNCKECQKPICVFRSCLVSYKEEICWGCRNTECIECKELMDMFTSVSTTEGSVCFPCLGKDKLIRVRQFGGQNNQNNQNSQNNKYCRSCGSTSNVVVLFGSVICIKCLEDLVCK